MADEWRELSVACTHCGKVLEARPVHSERMEIAGCEPMEYRHAYDKSKECFTRHDARPYSGWGRRDEWYAAGEVTEDSDE